MTTYPEPAKTRFWADTTGDEVLERFRALVNVIDDGLYQLDPDGRFVAVNDVIVETTGYSRDELLGSHVTLVLDEADVTRVEDLIRRRLVDEDIDLPTIELTVETASGREIPCELRFNLLEEDGEFRGSVGVVRDISELTRRIERERKLIEYETIFETVEDGIYVLDDEYRFTTVNQAYAGMTGYTREELVGSHCSLVVEDEISAEAARRSLELAKTEDDGATIEAHIRRRDGSRLPAESHFTPIVSGDDTYEGTIGVVRDVSERKARERALEASNERLEQFAYAASHDMQEPLRMVSSYLRLVDRRYRADLDDDGRKFVEFAIDGADRMQEMIGGLLQYSRVEMGGDPFEPVDLHAVLDDTLDDLQVSILETDAEVSAASLPTVHGDAGQLRQVFQNLVHNAIIYSGEDSPRVHVSAEQRGSTWVMAVADEGIGIDAEHQNGIFDVFQRLHSRDDYAGTGIGLALCERIVERHGGEIWVESEPDEGSTFFFSLPAAPDRRSPG